MGKYIIDRTTTTPIVGIKYLVNKVEVTLMWLGEIFIKVKADDGYIWETMRSRLRDLPNNKKL